MCHLFYTTYSLLVCYLLRAGRSGDRIPVGSRFSAPVQTGPGAQPASCTMGTGSFPEIKSGRGVTLTSHPILVPWLWKSRAILLLPLWFVRPVQSLSACTRVHFILPYPSIISHNYRVIYKSLRDFWTRLRNNQDRHGRKEHINR